MKIRSPATSGVASDVRNDPAVLDDRRSGRPEEAFGDLETSGRVLAPAPRARGEGHGMELPLRAERVDNPVCDNGHGTRPFVESEVVTIRCRVPVAPLFGAGAGIERLDHLAIVDAMKQDEAAVGHDWTAEPLSDWLGPHDLRAARSPVVSERWPSVDAVALRPKVLRPLSYGRLRAKPERD
jgi:hypothetical protein